MAGRRTEEGSQEGSEEAFSEAQENRLRELLAEVIGAGPKGDGDGDGDTSPPEVSDDAWARMSERDRESWVERKVAAVLGELRRDETIEDLKSKVDKLASEPEGKPKVLSALTRFLWGDDAA